MNNKPRKTIEIDKLVNTANEMLRNSELSQDAKRAVCIFLESALLEAHAYRGFINEYWVKTGYDNWHKDGCPYETQADYMGPEYDRRYF